MQRWQNQKWFGLGILALAVIVSSGCASTRGSNSCSTGACGSDYPMGDCDCASCESGSSGILTKARCQAKNRRAMNGCQSCGNGILGRLGGLAGVQCKGGNCGCGSCGCGGTGCVAGPLGWQQGGLDYSSHLNPGLLGHHAGQQLNNRPFTPGPPSAQVAYPYYTVRGPRDFLMADPPTIGR
ncbi:hypothetical protein Pla22_31300 [Rubripirellula amarantea]|uniref:Uncharacterized protein n=2 Tax=Rubripirellula amarantea TaxID=2527999 RepID=A0A5C5WHX0_9BACT|nr:hypothetical protein Pla22_31300 [Rubripirellula amarantea]